jgi:hypothetical protein
VGWFAVNQRTAEGWCHCMSVLGSTNQLALVTPQMMAP